MVYSAMAACRCQSLECIVNVEAKHWHGRVVNKYDTITNEKQRGPAFFIPELEPARQVPQALLAHCCTVIFCNRLYEPG